MTDESNERFESGDRVSVPWGLDVLDGIAISTYGEGDARRVVVSVDLPDVEGESKTQLVTLAPSALAHAAAVANEHRPGAWLHAYQYEQKLRDALESVIRGKAGLSQTEKSERSAISDAGADFYLQTGNHRLIIEAKTSSVGRVSRRAVDQLLDQLRRLHSVSGLIITDAELSTDARQRLEEAAEEGYQVRAVKWSSSNDNPALGRVIQELLRGGIARCTRSADAPAW